LITAQSLHSNPNALARHYSRFRVADRLMLTGHSHQAWPDCGFDAHSQAWLDAAEFADRKWDAAFEKAEQVRAGYARLLGDPGGDIALGQNTHELVTRFMSALPLTKKRRLVSTAGEFHTLRRQLDRLAEAGIDVVKVPSDDPSRIAERLCDAVDAKTAAVLVSSVLFQSAQIVPGLDAVADACEKVGAELLVDAYHHINIVPFSVSDMGLDRAYIVGGGYKYCQLGEGNCFLRLPHGCTLRPVITGWYSEFDAIAGDHADGSVLYGQRGNRFAGATYDPTSHYRASAVFEFFARHGLVPELLRDVSQHQIALLADRFDALDLDPSFIDRDRTVSVDRLGGFLTLTSERAGEISARLRESGVATDFRGDSLRLGPAPYLCDDQLIAAIDELGAACKEMNK